MFSLWKKVIAKWIHSRTKIEETDGWAADLQYHSLQHTQQYVNIAI
jgi:hypothetical protein